MTVFVSAVLLIGVIQNDPLPTATDPRGLYLHAATLLEQGPSQPAVDVLEQLIKQHAQTYYAELAVVHLAESYVFLDQPLEAVALLEQWRDRLRLPSQEAAKASAQLYERAQEVYTCAARAAASDYEIENDYVAVVRLLSKALQSSNTDQASVIEQDILRAAIAGCLRESAKPGSVENILVNVDEKWCIPVRFSLAEQLIAEGRIQEAQVQLDWLATAADDAATQDTIGNLLRTFSTDSERSSIGQHESETTDRQDTATGTGYPPWAVTVALRRCELYVRHKPFTAAEKLLEDSRSAYSDSDLCYEFDFLLARCAIARIDFGTALKILHSIAERESTPLAASSKAQWMIGEIHFLKQDFPRAIEAYQRASDIEAPLWQSRALLQMARCQELSGQFPAALQTYQRLRSQFGRSPDTEHAQSRIAFLLKQLDD